MICTFSRNLAQMLGDGDRVVRDTQRSMYNQIHTRTFDCVRWFLGLHYKFNTRLDTPFWTECRRDADCAGINAVIEYYRENGPSSLFRNALLDPADPFGVEGYLIMLVGQRVPYQKSYTPSENDLRAWSLHRAQVRRNADLALTTDEAQRAMFSPSWRWDRSIFAGAENPATVQTATA